MGYLYFFIVICCFASPVNQVSVINKAEAEYVILILLKLLQELKNKGKKTRIGNSGDPYRISINFIWIYLLLKLENIMHVL